MIGRLARRPRPPEAALAHLARGERVLAWAELVSGEALLATPRGLWWPEPATSRLIGWQHIDKALWRDGTLTVVQADVLDDVLLVERAPVSAELRTPRDLPVTVRARVQANVVRSQVVAVDGGAARVVARRVPGQDGLVWWARLEPGTPDTAVVRAEVGAQLVRLRGGPA